MPPAFAMPVMMRRVLIKSFVARFSCRVSAVDMLMSVRPQGWLRVRSGRGPPNKRLKRALLHVLHGGPATTVWKNHIATAAKMQFMTPRR